MSEILISGGGFPLCCGDWSGASSAGFNSWFSTSGSFSWFSGGSRFDVCSSFKVVSEEDEIKAVEINDECVESGSIEDEVTGELFGNEMGL